MVVRKFAGHEVTLDEEGYFADPLQWNEEVAAEMAREEGLLLTEKYLEVLRYLRRKYFDGKKLSLRDINRSGIISLREFYAMFSGAPLRTSSRLAGLPKPESCV